MTPRVSIITAPSLSTTKLIHDLGKLVQYRDLLYTLSVHRIKVRYKQSVLGGLWAILQPVSLMLMFTFIYDQLPTGQLSLLVATLAVFAVDIPIMLAFSVARFQPLEAPATH